MSITSINDVIKNLRLEVHLPVLIKNATITKEGDTYIIDTKFGTFKSEGGPIIDEEQCYEREPYARPDRYIHFNILDDKYFYFDVESTWYGSIPKKDGDSVKVNGLLYEAKLTKVKLAEIIDNSPINFPINTDLRLEEV